MQEDEKPESKEAGDEKKFDSSGYDKDLVEGLERDILQRNPNVHWYGVHCRYCKRASVLIDRPAVYIVSYTYFVPYIARKED